jgi:enamine deaminase RidA (YjgF/YER057c/UK114 family)
MKKNSRRKMVKAMVAGAAAMGTGVVAKAAVSTSSNSKKVVGEVITFQQKPLFSSAVAHGNTLYIAGKGAHFDGDITAHTKHVLDELEKALVKNGSSMDKVLKVNVYLHDLVDYKAMNEAYRGRFGDNPPVRTTVATYGGVPGDSLVEIDCIAALD